MKYKSSKEEIENVKYILSRLSDYTVKELKEKILFYIDKNTINKTNNFLEKIEIKNYLKEILLFKLSKEDLKILLNEEMKKQNIIDERSSSSTFVTFADVINDCDKKSLIDMLLKSKND